MRAEGGSVTKAVSGVLQWPAKESIGKAEYIYCVERTAAVTVPNENGLQLRQKIWTIESKRLLVSNWSCQEL